MANLSEADTDKIIDDVEQKAGRQQQADDAGDAGDGQAEPRQTLAEKMAAAAEVGEADDSGPIDDDAGEPDDLGDDEGAADASGEEENLRQRLGKLGLVGLDRFEDDDTAIRAISDDYNRMADRLAELEELRAQPATDTRAPAETAPEKEPDKPTWWKLPDFDPAWRDKVEFDEESGAYRHKLGKGTPQIAEKVNDYVSGLKAEQEKFWQNPFEYIGEFVRHTATECAAAGRAERDASDSQRHAAEQFLSQNEEWLVKRDDQKRPVFDPQSGRPMPSDEGAQFIQLVSTLDREGVPVHLQGPIAKSFIERDRFARQQAGAAGGGGAAPVEVDAEATRAKRNVEIQRNAAKRSTGRGGTVRGAAGGAGGNAKPQSQNRSLSL